MVNGDYLEVGVGSSCDGWRSSCVLDQQWLGVRVAVNCRSILPALHASNRWNWTEPWVKLLALPAAPVSWLRVRRVAKGARIASVSLARPPSQTRVGRRNLRPVLKHGPRSVTNVRVIGFTKPKGAVKAKVFGLRHDPLWAQCRHFSSTSFLRSSKSTFVATRKMVNYAWPG